VGDVRIVHFVILEILSKNNVVIEVARQCHQMQVWGMQPVAAGRTNLLL